MTLRWVMSPSVDKRGAIPALPGVGDVEANVLLSEERLIGPL